MATVIGTAFAFAGASALTNVVTKYILGDDRGEFKRHNLAMEQLSRARDEFNKQRQQRLDFINTTLRDQHHAERTFSDLGAAMQEYYEVTEKRISPLKEPKLSDFYNPSRKQKDGEIVLVLGGMAVVGLLAYKFTK